MRHNNSVGVARLFEKPLFVFLFVLILFTLFVFFYILALFSLFNYRFLALGLLGLRIFVERLLLIHVFHLVIFVREEVVDLVMTVSVFFVGARRSSRLVVITSFCASVVSVISLIITEVIPLKILWSFLFKGTPKVDVFDGSSGVAAFSLTFLVSSRLGRVLNTDTGPFEASLAASVSVRNRSLNDFFSPVANAPKPPPPAKLLKPLALALLLPSAAKADFPKVDEDPKLEDAPNSVPLGLVVVEAPREEGAPNTEVAPNTGFDEPAIGVPVAKGEEESAEGVLLNAPMVGVFGGLKKGESDGVVAPNAPKPDWSLPKPEVDAVRLAKAPPLEAGVLGLSKDGDGVANTLGVLGDPKVDVDLGGVDGGTDVANADGLVGLASFSLDSSCSLRSCWAVSGFASGVVDFAAEPKVDVPPANAAKPPPEAAVEEPKAVGVDAAPSPGCPKAD